MNITFIGDVHGKTGLYTKLVDDVPDGEQTFQIGDMGLGFEGVRLPQRDLEHRFIRGNHDDPAKCQAHPNYAGEFGYDPSLRLFYLGGAWSIDGEWRRQKMYMGCRAIWWRDEECSPEQLEEAIALFKREKPVLVATHEAPSSIVPEILPRGFREEKLECKDTRTSAALEQMFQAHRPKLWVFGHYHIDREITVDGTRFVCLNELSKLTIEA